MALKKQLELESGLTINDAYLRIEQVNGDKNRLTFNLVSYVSLEACNAGKVGLKADSFVFNPSVADDSPNFIKQGYLYLKTLPQFVTAIDV